MKYYSALLCSKLKLPRGRLNANELFSARERMTIYGGIDGKPAARRLRGSSEWGFTNWLLQRAQALQKTTPYIA